MLAPVASNPAPTYAQALERARAFAALDDDRVLPVARTALFERGTRTPLAVVLFHGITNNPAQYREFAPLLPSKASTSSFRGCPSTAFAIA